MVDKARTSVAGKNKLNKYQERRSNKRRGEDVSDNASDNSHIN
jgi:hypothetical protein